jgi:hypothetical protein
MPVRTRRKRLHSTRFGKDAVTKIVAELKISVDDKGHVSVNGPLDQLMLCYGMLEVAKDVLQANAAERAKRIQAPAMGDVVVFGKPS